MGEEKSEVALALCNAHLDIFEPDKAVHVAVNELQGEKLEDFLHYLAAYTRWIYQALVKGPQKG